jgi:hypothetical protein
MIRGKFAVPAHNNVHAQQASQPDCDRQRQCQCQCHETQRQWRPLSRNAIEFGLKS